MATRLRSPTKATRSTRCIGCYKSTTEGDKSRLVCSSCATNESLFGRTALGQDAAGFWCGVDRAADYDEGCECRGRTSAPLFDEEDRALTGVTAAGLTWGTAEAVGPGGDDAASSDGGGGDGDGDGDTHEGGAHERTASAPRADAPVYDIPDRCREQGLALPCIVKDCPRGRCTTCVLGAFHAGADANLARTCHVHRMEGSAARRAASDGSACDPPARSLHGARPTCGAALCVLAHEKDLFLGAARACGSAITFADPFGLVAGLEERALAGGHSDGTEWVESTIKAIAVPHAVVLADSPSGEQRVCVVMAHAVCMAYEHAMVDDGVLVRSGLASEGAGSYVARASRAQRGSVEG